MKMKEYKLSVKLPDVKEFSSQYRLFASVAQGRGLFLFNIIMQPESFIRCKVVTELEHSAVWGIADICYNESTGKDGFDFDDQIKRFIGAAVCSLMLANGYKKKEGKKGRKSIPHTEFRVGQVYEK
jgi:hypothetical protein